MISRNCSRIKQTGTITPERGRQERSGVSAERRQYRLLSTIQPEQLRFHLSRRRPVLANDRR